jgi:hypothetical protein
MSQTPEEISAGIELTRLRAEQKERLTKALWFLHDGVPSSVYHSITRALRSASKHNRKLRDRYNFLAKRLPGKGRIYELDRLADELEMEADFRSEQVIIERDDENKISLEMSVDTSRMRDDATFLRRLAYDLAEMRDFARGNPRKGTEKWPFEMERRP